ncbi:MAG: hypothetical protein OXO53_11970 [Chloroflexota bacterium]|nr:hypothetical protein [Chloroflexota bacterium]
MPTSTPVSIEEYAETFCTWGISFDLEEGLLLDSEVRRSITPPAELRAYHDATVHWHEQMLRYYRKNNTIFGGLSIYSEELDRIGAEEDLFSADVLAKWEKGCATGGTHERSIFHQIATPSPSP